MRIDPIIETLDLGECADRAELVERLQSRRAFQLEYLDRNAIRPYWLPVFRHASLLAESEREVRLCEEALTGFGEPFEAAPILEPSRARVSDETRMARQIAAADQHDQHEALR